jgi:hypothetical protein
MIKKNREALLKKEMIIYNSKADIEESAEEDRSPNTRPPNACTILYDYPK